MMTKKLFTLFIIHSFLNSYVCFSQVSENDNNPKIASVQTSQKSNLKVYVFTPLTDFDEFRTPQ